MRRGLSVTVLSSLLITSLVLVIVLNINPYYSQEVSGKSYWVKQLIGEYEDYGNSIYVDQYGLIYVVGYTSSYGNVTVETSTYTSPPEIYRPGDPFIAVIDPSGDLSWFKTFGGKGLDEAYDVIVDNDSSIYIAGYTRSFNTIDGGVFIAKFNSFGNLVWFRVIDTEYQDIGYGITLDNSSNIYIVGVSGDNGFIAKLNSSGGLVWYKIVDVGSTSGFHDIAIDHSGNIVVVGYSIDIPESSFYRNIVVLKLNSIGEPLWIKWVGDTFYEYSRVKIAIDSNDNIYVAGDRENYNSLSIEGELIKFSSNGGIEWVKRMSSPNSDISINDLVIDNTDHLYLTGSYSIPIQLSSDLWTFDYDFYVMNMEGNGEVLWVKKIGVLDKIETANSIYVDENGDICLTGSTSKHIGDQYSDPDVLIARLDSNFTFELSSSILSNISISEPQLASGVTSIDLNETTVNITTHHVEVGTYTPGVEDAYPPETTTTIVLPTTIITPVKNTTTTAVSTEIQTTVENVSETPVEANVSNYWVEVIDAPLKENGTGIHVHSGGDLFVGGIVYSGGYQLSDRIVLSRIDTYGSVKWFKYLKLPGEAYLSSLHVNNEYIYIAGLLIDNASMEVKGFTAKLDLDGEPVWSKVYDVYMFIQDMVVNGNNVFIAGYTAPETMNKLYGFIAKIDGETGDLEWFIRVDAGNISSITGIEVQGDKLYSLIQIFDPSKAGSDLAVMSMNVSGEINWIRRIYTPRQEVIGRIVLAGDKIVLASIQRENLLSSASILAVITMNTQGELTSYKLFNADGIEFISIADSAYSNGSIYFVGEASQLNTYKAYLLEITNDDQYLIMFNNTLIPSIDGLCVRGNTIYMVGSMEIASDSDIVVAKLGKDSFLDIGEQYTVSSTTSSNISIDIFNVTWRQLDVTAANVSFDLEEQRVLIHRLYFSGETNTQFSTTFSATQSMSPTPTETLSFSPTLQISVTTVSSGIGPGSVVFYIVLVIAIVAVTVAVLVFLLKK